MLGGIALYDRLTALPTGGAWTDIAYSEEIPCAGLKAITFFVFVHQNSSATYNQVQLSVEFSRDRAIWTPVSVMQSSSTTLGSDSPATVTPRRFGYRTQQSDNAEMFPVPVFTDGYAFARARLKEVGDTTNVPKASVEWTQGDGSGAIHTLEVVEPRGGDVLGPASSTDNAIARWDGTTGKVLQDSSALVSDGGNLYVPGAIDIGNVSDTTLARSSAGNVTIEGNIIYRAGGTDVPITDGGTGASTAATARSNLGLLPKVISGEGRTAGTAILPMIGGAVTGNVPPVSTTAYFLFLKVAQEAFTIDYVRFLITANNALAATYTEVGVFTGAFPAFPSGTVTLTKVAAGATGAIESGSVPRALVNTSALGASIAVGDIVYIGYTISATVGTMILRGVGAIDGGAGCYLSLLAAGQFTTNSSWAATYPGLGSQNTVIPWGCAVVQ